MFGKKKQPSPPPGAKQVGNSWRVDPGPHTCEFRWGYQLNRNTVRWSCTHCEATKDTTDTPPPTHG